MDCKESIHEQIAKAKHSIVSFIARIIEFPCTLASSSLLITDNRFIVYFPIALFIDILIGQICYLFATINTYKKLVNAKIFDSTYKIDIYDDANEYKQFHEKLFRANNITPYFPPLIITYHKVGVINKKCTCFPSYDDVVVITIPKGSDLSYPVNQAKLSHEITHAAIHFGVKQIKYLQILAMLIYGIINLIAMLKLNYWWGLIQILLIPLYIFVAVTDQKIKSEIQADNFGLRYIKINHNLPVVKEVANKMIYIRLGFLLNNKWNSVETRRIKALSELIDCKQKESLLQNLQV